MSPTTSRCGSSTGGACSRARPRRPSARAAGSDREQQRQLRVALRHPPPAVIAALHEAQHPPADEGVLAEPLDLQAGRDQRIDHVIELVVPLVGLAVLEPHVGFYVAAIFVKFERAPAAEVIELKRDLILS